MRDDGVERPSSGPTRLPAQVVTLIQHLQLTEAGWWETGIRRLIRSIIWLADRPLTAEEIAGDLDRELGVRLTPAEVDEQAEQLIQRDELLLVEGRRYKLPEAQLASLENELAEGMAIDANARQRFEQALGQRCPDLPVTGLWDRFNDELLSPLICELGASAYQFILGEPFDLEISPHQQRFLGSFDEGCRPRLQHVIVDFLDPTDGPTRAYVLRKLATYFFVEAARLPEETLRTITTISGRTPEFWVLVDTNFLFSLLALHDNPSNDSARALLALREQVAPLVDLRFYVTQETLAEAQAALLHAQELTENLVLRGSLGVAATQLSFNGLAAKFASESLRPGGATRSADYFGPIIRNLLQMARANGIDLYEGDLAALHMRQDVVDDVVSHLEFEKTTRGSRAKSYERVQHDVVLWHLVGDLRTGWVESPLTAKYWIGTVDFRFLGFDLHKLRRSNIQRCIHPTTLTQVLQFWVPRSTQLDNALVGSLRMPFLFLDIDTDGEKVVQRILETLGRFDGASELTVETVMHMVMNENLRHRIAEATSAEEEIELVRLELIDHDRRVREELDAARARVEEISSAHGRATDELDELRQREASLQDDLQRTSEVVDDLASQLAEHTDRIRRRDSLLSFYAKRVLPLLIGPAVLIGGVAALLIVLNHARMMPISLFALAAWVLAGILLTTQAALSHPYAQTQLVWRRARRLRQAVILVVVVPVLGGAVYDLVRFGLHATFPAHGHGLGH